MPPSLSLRKTWLWLTAFSVAMGFLETAVVVYLRELYYPAGFAFPLAPIKPGVAVTELLREAATLLMLLSVGVLTGRTAAQRFSFAIYSFAVWDLGYYLFLKLLLDWPASLLTWDILFLIPVPWVGPVLAPCLVALTMTGLAVVAVRLERRGYALRFTAASQGLWWIGSLLILASFMADYVAYVQEHGRDLWTASGGTDLFSEAPAYVPKSFNWWLFGLGEAGLLAGIACWIWQTTVQKPAALLRNLPKRTFANPDAGGFSDYLNGL
jgi:hypothetical protein